MYRKKVSLANESDARITILVLGGKWKPQILKLLAAGPLRPSQLIKALPEAGVRVVNQQLSELLHYGVVSRRAIDVVKPYSLYALTECGRALLPIIDAMERWGSDFRSQFNDATPYV